jgi:uncharacterized heparinase superfamily protein
MPRGSVASHTRISTLLLGRFARNAASRLSLNTLAVSKLWPGRTDRLVIAPQDLRTTDATRAAEIYAGRFVFAGKIVTCNGRSPFDIEAPSDDWETALFGFGWLRHLRAADTAITRANARSLVDEWIARQNRSQAVAWRPEVLARRVMSLLSQAPLVLTDSDGRFYRRYLRNLTRETRYLRSTVREATDGVARLQVLIALTYATLCLANQGNQIKNAARRLSEELARQILPDGGHVSRNPAALVESLLDLLPLRQTFAARNIMPPQALMNAIDRMMPMLRFFRHGDGTFALFNGMGPTSSDLVATILAYDDSRGAPVASMTHSGYERIEAGRSIVLMDVGPPPPPALSQEAHAGTLSFELSSGPCRVVVNCGVPSTGRENWRPHARSTAAHSTLVYHDTSSCQFVEAGAVKRLLQGAPIVAGPQAVEVQRDALEDGTLITASHDGYYRQFGLFHRRVIMLSHDGNRLDGEDSLVFEGRSPTRNVGDDYAVCFHLHPTVKASRLSDAHGAMLMLPNRDVWTFEAFNDTVHLEDSVFLAGSDGARRTTQIVIRQQAREALTVRWAFVKSSGGAAATRRQPRRGEPELPL